MKSNFERITFFIHYSFIIRSHSIIIRASNAVSSVICLAPVNFRRNPPPANAPHWHADWR